MLVIILRYITSCLLSSAKHGTEKNIRKTILVGQLSGNAPAYTLDVI